MKEFPRIASYWDFKLCGVWLTADRLVTIALDQLLRKVPGYSGKNTMAACLTCHSVLCPCFCRWKAISIIGKKSGSLIIFKHWVHTEDLNSLGERPHPEMMKVVGSLKSYSD